MPVVELFFMPWRLDPEFWKIVGLAAAAAISAALSASGSPRRTGRKRPNRRSRSGKGLQRKKSSKETLNGDS